MSSVMYISSDAPLEARPNPHERMLSVNEALAMGVRDLPEILLSADFDRDKPNAVLVADREVNINVDTGVIEDGDYDDDFAVMPTEKLDGMCTEKTYCAFFEWVRYTPGRARLFIDYLRRQLESAEEIELHHAWLGNDLCSEVSCRRIAIGDICADDIAALEKTDVWSAPSDCCYVITK